MKIKSLVILNELLKTIMYYAVVFQVALLAQIHARLLEIPFIAAGLVVVILITQSSFSTDIYKLLKGRPLDSLIFMNTTLFSLLCYSVGNPFRYVKSTINEIKEYRLQPGE